MSKNTKILALSLCLFGASTSLPKDDGWYGWGCKKGNEFAENAGEHVGGLIGQVSSKSPEVIHTALKCGIPVVKGLAQQVVRTPTVKYHIGQEVVKDLPDSELFIADHVCNFATGIYNTCCPTTAQKGLSNLVDGATDNRVAKHEYTRAALGMATRVLQASFIQFLAIKCAGNNANKIDLVKGNMLEHAVVEGVERLSGKEFGMLKGIALFVTGKTLESTTGQRSSYRSSGYSSSSHDNED